MKSLSAIALAAFIGLQRVYASESCVINYHTVTAVKYVYKPYPSDFTSQFSAVKSSALESSSASTLDADEGTSSTASTKMSFSSATLTASSSSEVATSASTSSTESSSSMITSSKQSGFFYNLSTLASKLSSSLITPSSTSSTYILSTSASSADSTPSTSSSSPSTSSPSTSSPSTSSSSTSSSSTSSPSTSSPSTSSTSSSPSSKSTSSSSTSTSTTATSTSSSSAFEETYLDMHNKYRSLHEDTPDMTWNSGVAAVAQSYADSYSCDGVLTHSGNKYNNSGLGENLAYGYDFDDAGAVTAWYDEIEYYNYSDPGFSEKTGHFTQVVWKDSTELGCGYKYCGDYYGYYIVCNYLPEGNIVSSGSDSGIYFEENVLPLKS